MSQTKLTTHKPLTRWSLMDVKGYGGPHEEPWVPWNKPRPTDSTYFRSPQSRALQQVKNEIHCEEKWDDFKKITNPYEYVFLSWNRRSSRSVSTRQPLSRSYFKMIEMWVTTGLGTLLEPLVAAAGGQLRTAHSAEGPGGFIEACWEHAKRLGWTVAASHAMTLQSEARNIPGWRKAARFLTDRPAIQVHNGVDGTGNILQKANQDAFVSSAVAEDTTGVHLYTADGGFDFSSDYNSQEDVIFPLLVAEGLLGLRTLVKGGCMILKCFDTTERATLDFLWILTRCFMSWQLVKPKTSRAGNAERYFVGISYLGTEVVADTIEFLEDLQAQQRWSGPLFEPPKTPSERACWSAWLTNVLMFQECLERQEYETIRKTLDLIHSHDVQKICSLVRENIQRSLNWCRGYGEPISSIWSSDFERNITRESTDLLQILSPASTRSHLSWYTRSTTGVHLTFEGFRSGSVEAVYAAPAPVNPFQRLG